MHKASVITQESESKTAFGNYGVVKMPSMFRRPVSFTWCHPFQRILWKYTENWLQWHGRKLIFLHNNMRWSNKLMWFYLGFFLKSANQCIWERLSVGTYLPPALVPLTVTDFGTLGFTQIWLMARHAPGVLPTATLLLNLLGSKTGREKQEAFNTRERKTKIKCSTTICKGKFKEK